MPLPTRIQLDNTHSVHKSDTMKSIRASLEKAKKDLIAAQQEGNAKRVAKLQQIIADLTGAVERN